MNNPALCSKMPTSQHASPRALRPRHITLPPLHELEEWSFSADNVSGPKFSDVTFDNSTLWSSHRYHCYSDRDRESLVFSSKIFEGEVACHTSLIKLRHELKDLDLYVQVERFEPALNRWTVLN